MPHQSNGEYDSRKNRNGVAVTSLSEPHAELLAALLRGRGIPAWVIPTPSFSLEGPSDLASVMVTEERLADAEKVMTEADRRRAAE
jgi:hypothetical protein